MSPFDDALARAQIQCLLRYLATCTDEPTDVEWYAQQLLAETWKAARPQHGVCGRLYRTSTLLISTMAIAAAATLVQLAHVIDTTQAVSSTLERATGTFIIAFSLATMPTLYAGVYWIWAQAATLCCTSSRPPHLDGFTVPRDATHADLCAYIAGVRAMHQYSRTRIVPRRLDVCVENNLRAVACQSAPSRKLLKHE
jgi:hypothetical protein